MKNVLRTVTAFLVMAALGAATVGPVGAQEGAEQAASSVDTLSPTPAMTATNAVAAPLASMVFKPNDPITRAQAARMLHRIAGSPAPGDECGEMTDVPTWARDGICWLVNNDYATGYPDRTFRPNNSITRAQAAQMLHRIAGSPAPGDGCGEMIDVPTWARDGICWLVNNDYATGYPYDPEPTPAENRATVVSQVNGVRAMYSLPSLAPHPTLEAKAQGWAQHLAWIGRLEHSNLTSGVPPYWQSLAENVGYGSSLLTVHNLFLGSSGHRANILGNFTHIGAGVAWAGDRVYVVHVFMRA